MTGRWLSLPLLALMLAGCAASMPGRPAAIAVATPGGEMGPVPAEYLPQVRTAERLGGLIYQKDRSAALAISLLERQGVIAADRRLEGWVARPQAGGWLVRFVGAGSGSFGALYDVAVPAAGTARMAARHASPQELTPAEREMYRARATALASGFRACSKDYNTVVLPADAPPGAWQVYLLAATRVPGEVVFGGHHRITVSADGGEVVQATPLSNSCLTVGRDLGGGRTLSELFVTHIVSPAPIETHIYLNLLHGLPITVSADTGSWRIEQGRVTGWSGRPAAGSG